jgi:hypothetical protein
LSSPGRRTGPFRAALLTEPDSSENSFQYQTEKT